MKKKLLILLIVTIMFSISIVGVKAEDTNWTKEYEITGTNLKYKIEGIDLEFYYDEKETITDDNGTINYSKKVKAIDPISLDQTTYNINPTYKKGLNKDNQEDNSTFIDIGLNLTREQLGALILNEITKTGSTIDASKDLTVDVVVKYKWTELPTYTNYYSTNLVDGFLGLVENSVKKDEAGYTPYTIPTITKNVTTKQVINSAIYQTLEEDEEKPTITSPLPIDNYDEDKVFKYYTKIEGTESEAVVYNFEIFTNNEYTLQDVAKSLLGEDLTTKDENDTVVLFHDIEDVDYLINYRKNGLENINEELEDIYGEQKVEVPNTVVKNSKAMVIASIMLILTGFVMIFGITRLFYKNNN